MRKKILKTHRHLPPSSSLHLRLPHPLRRTLPPPAPTPPTPLINFLRRRKHRLFITTRIIVLRIRAGRRQFGARVE